jgi:hypothetical protein
MASGSNPLRLKLSTGPEGAAGVEAGAAWALAEAALLTENPLPEPDVGNGDVEAMVRGFRNIPVFACANPGWNP